MIEIAEDNSIFFRYLKAAHPAILRRSGNCVQKHETFAHECEIIFSGLLTVRHSDLSLLKAAAGGFDEMKVLTGIFRDGFCAWKAAVRFSKAPYAKCFSSYSKICYSASRNGFDNYEVEKASWNVTIPDKFNFASDVLDVWSQKEKEGVRRPNPAFWFVYENGEELKWSFQDLERETKRTANMLEQCGVRRGDNVLVMLPKLPEFWMVNIAAMRTGFVLTPATMQLTAKDLSYRLASFKPSCIIAHQDVAAVVDQAADSNPSLKTKIIVSTEKNSSRKSWHDFHSLLKKANSDHKCVETGSDETMMVFFTSGTTGNPKMVEHTHSSYGIGHRNTGKYMLDLTSDCILWNLSDTGWAKTAYSNIFAPWSWGACVFVHQMPRFQSVQTLEILSKYPIDTFCAPPMAYRMMVQEDLKAYNFNKLQHCITGGEALNPEVNRVWKSATELNIYEGYGQTESVMLTGMYKCLEFKTGSIGKPSPGLNIVIVDENENEVGPGVEGEIAIKRTGERIFGLFKGYKDEPELTKQRLTMKYFHTGDLGYRDENDYFYFVGRKDDLINSAGYRIGPFEVESALMEHPNVVEAAVISSPDDERGEVVKAFIVLKEFCEGRAESDLIKELQEHTKKTTAPYKYPRKIEFIKELPKTASGKIKRFELRKKEWSKQ